MISPSGPKGIRSVVYFNGTISKQITSNLNLICNLGIGNSLSAYNGTVYVCCYIGTLEIPHTEIFFDFFFDFFYDFCLIYSSILNNIFNIFFNYIIFYCIFIFLILKKILLYFLLFTLFEISNFYFIFEKLINDFLLENSDKILN